MGGIIIKEIIYVVQGRGGIVFSATTDYKDALKAKESLDKVNGDKGILTKWVDGKCI